MNPIDNAWMLLKEVTLEDLRQAARTGGLPATPERIQAARGHLGIPAALAGIEPFQRFGDGQTTGTAGQRMAERIMAAQEQGRLNEFGQPHEEGYDSPAYHDLPASLYDEGTIDEARHDPDSGNLDPDKIFLPDESMPDPMTVHPPEVTSSIDAGFFPKTLQGEQAGNPEEIRRFERNYDSDMRNYGPATSQRRDDRGIHRTQLVQNPRNYGRYSGTSNYDPFSFKNRIQTQEPVEDTEFADLSRPETMPQMEQLGQSLADFPEFPEGVQPDPDAGRRQFEAQANRARSLAARSAQPSTASPMDAAMQALGNRKAEEAARIPKPVQRRALNTRRGGRGRGPNSRRNRRR